MKKLLTSDVYQVRSSYMLDLTGYKTVTTLSTIDWDGSYCSLSNTQ